jgi:N utilization substance protein A
MSELSKAIRNICEEKGLSYEAVLSTIEQALAAAYRKDYGQKNQNIKVEFNPETAGSKVYDVKTVVEDMPEEEDEENEEGKGEAENKEDKNPEEEIRKFNPRTEIQLSDAKMLKKDAELGEEIKTKLDPPESYGRMAAQTAKQVIIQRLREAEREMIFNEFQDKQGEVVSGVIQRREGRNILVDLGKSVGIILKDNQIYGENYNSGERIKVYIKEVRQGSKGAEIILSRTSSEILKKIFYLEIPEISNGLIEIKSVAREAGSRSKVAIYTDSDNVDPIGSCVGQRGSRIQTIISELGGEKVDIIEWDEDPKKFIANSLSPAKIINIEINEEEKRATVKVAEDQLSLAIGKSGQNARLAARLTGWKIDIVEADSEKSEKEPQNSPEENEDTKSKNKKEDKVSDEEEENKKESLNSLKKDETTKSKEIAESKKEKKSKEKKESQNDTEKSEDTENKEEKKIKDKK